MNKTKRAIHKWAWVFLAAYCVIGLIYPLIGIAAIVCMLAPSIVAIFKGRMWCGNFCPRGSFSDTILAKFSLKNKLPKFFKTSGFRLIFFALLMGAFAVQIVFAWGNFLAVSFVFIRMIIITTVLTILLGIAYTPRAWCTICPMGTMAHYVTKLQVARSQHRHISFQKDQCIDCRICSKSCPIGIDVLSHKDNGKVTHADCLKCEVCVDKCPKKSLHVA